MLIILLLTSNKMLLHLQLMVGLERDSSLKIEISPTATLPDVDGGSGDVF